MPDAHTIHLTLTDVRKTYPSPTGEDIHACDGLSLAVPQGQLLAITGPSGSGKTTLLHLIGGLIAPTAGVIRIGDTDLTQLSDHELTLFRRRHVGVIFQAFNLIPTLTAEENILLPILADGRRSPIPPDAIRPALETLLDRLGLSARRHHYPDALSGGEQQRTAIARALLPDLATQQHGSLLLADEPTGNLDSAASENICRLLRELCDEQHHTMLIVTHERAVADWCDRIVTLRDGRLVEDRLNDRHRNG